MPPADTNRTPQTFWDDVHSRRNPARPGQPHAHLVTYLSGLRPGRALELGSGDGADAIWLAQQGWRVTAVDVSSVINGIAAEHARQANVEERIAWVTADLNEWRTNESFDLIFSAFLHATFGLDRTGVLRRAAELVRPGGTLLVVGHLTLPPWAWDADDTSGLPSARELADALALDADEWPEQVAEDRERDVAHADGRRAQVTDAVLCARRRRVAA